MIQALIVSLLLATLQNADVVKLVKAGLSAETIEAKIDTSETSFDTSTDALVALANDGVPDRVIRAMIERGSSPAAEPPRAKPAVARAKSNIPTRRYDVAVHASEHAKCEGELRVDAKGIRATRCRQLDFDLPWAAITRVRFDYGARGVVVLTTAKGEHRLSTTTPAEAEKIVEHIRGAVPTLPVVKE